MALIAGKSSALRSARLNAYAKHCEQDSTQAQHSAQMPPKSNPGLFTRETGVTGK
jgi:hypothetical protein